MNAREHRPLFWRICATLVGTTVLLIFVASPSPIAAGEEDEPELVPLETGVCFHNATYYRDSHPVFQAILDSEQQSAYEFAKPLMRDALLGRQYTGYLQLYETVSSDPLSPFGAGTYAECELGCVKEFTYFGSTYRDVCLNQICREGPINDKQTFCAPELSTDVYYMHQMFWCDDYPRVAMYCGSGAHCVDTEEGSKCRTYSDQGLSNTHDGLTYQIALPDTPSGVVAVVAYLNGSEIARSDLDTALAEMLAAGIVLHAEDAERLAEEIGLVDRALSVLREDIEEGFRVFNPRASAAVSQWGMQCSVP